MGESCVGSNPENELDEDTFLIYVWYESPYLELSGAHYKFVIHSP